MKIYNKKNLIGSLLFCILGLVLFVTSLIKGFDLKSILLIIGCLFFGMGGMIRSTSKTYAKEDLLEERDERNQLINLKAKSKALGLTQTISFVMGLLFVILGAVNEEMLIICFGFGMVLLCNISLIAEIFTYIYYEKQE